MRSPVSRRRAPVAGPDRPGGRSRVAGGGALLLALLAATACAAEPSATSPSGASGDRLRVVTSMSVLADLVGEVGGPHVEVESLVPVGADPHTHEPRPSDARAVADADLVVGNGIGLEPWFDALVAAADEVVLVADDLEGAVVADADGRPDPHRWMVPATAADYVRALADELASLDPEHAEAYTDRAEAHARELEALDAELAEQLAAIPDEHRLLVTSHDAYRYFAAHYDLELDTALGVTTEADASAARLQRLVDRVRARDLPAVFAESTVDPRVVERVARDAGAAVAGPLYGDSVGEPGSGAETYVGMMRANVAVLVEGLAP